MLTSTERDQVRELFSRGPSALLDAGYSHETAFAFISRVDVKDELLLLDREFLNREGYDARLKFATKKQFAKFAGGAAAVLVRALAGPSYDRDSAGNIKYDAKGRPLVKDPGPNDTQVGAAQDILDRLGVHSEKKEGLVDAMSVPSLMGPVVTQVISHEDDPANITHEQRALSRERIRNAMLVFSGLIAEGKAKVDEVLGAKKPKPAKKPKGKSTNIVSQPTVTTES